MDTKTIRLHENDNVVTAKSEIDINIKIEDEDLSTKQHIPVGHKIATQNINQGDDVIKYDNIIGTATREIKKGDHIHVHNLGMSDKKRDYEFSQGCKNTNVIPENNQAKFMGFKRKNGKVGTRNFVGIISSVNCSATVCKKISDTFDEEYMTQYPNVDGVVSITHSLGCGGNSSGMGWDLLQATMDGYSRHVNFGGLVVIGPGM